MIDPKTVKSGSEIPPSPPKPSENASSLHSEGFFVKRDENETHTSHNRVNPYAMNTTLIDWRPAKYYAGATPRVEYYVRNPFTGKMQRFKIKIAKLSANRSEKKVAAELCARINSKLTAGWNPIMELQEYAQSKTWHDAVEFYKKKHFPDLREESKASYNSVLGIFEAWLKKNGLLAEPIKLITQQHAVKFLTDRITYDRISARTHNNNLIVMKSLFNYLKQYKIIGENPFQGIHTRKAQAKRRQYIPKDWLEKITAHLYEHHRPLYFVAELCRRCGIRPGETARLKIHNFHFAENVLEIHGDQSKNKKTEYVTIPKQLNDQLRDHFKDVSPDHFLFSTSKALLPSPRQTSSRSYFTAWANMRKKLGVPMEYTLYSNKDTGITNLLRQGITPLSVKDQFRHHSLDMTTKYLQSALPVANDQLLDT